MDLKQELSKQLTKINVKTSTFLEETKIKTYISTLENEIKELKQKAGELGYEIWKQEEAENGKLTQLYEEIKGKYAAIEEQERAIKELTEKNKQFLGASETDGRSAEQDKMNSDTDKVFCPACGEAYPPAVNFCRKCGTKLH